MSSYKDVDERVLGADQSVVYKRPSIQDAIDIADMRNGDPDIIASRMADILERACLGLSEVGDKTSGIFTLIVGHPRYGWFTAPVKYSIGVVDKPRLELFGIDILPKWHYPTKIATFSVSYEFNGKREVGDKKIRRTIQIDNKKNTPNEDQLHSAALVLNNEFLNWVDGIYANLTRKSYRSEDYLRAAAYLRGKTGIAYTADDYRRAANSLRSKL